MLSTNISFVSSPRAQAAIRARVDRVLVRVIVERRVAEAAQVAFHGYLPLPGLGEEPMLPPLRLQRSGADVIFVRAAAERNAKRSEEIKKEVFS